MIEVQNSIDGFITNLKIYGNTINGKSVGDLVTSNECCIPQLDRYGRKQYHYSILSRNEDGSLVDRKEFVLPYQLESHDDEKDFLYWDKNLKEWCISKIINSDNHEGRVLYIEPRIIRTGIVDFTFLSLRAYKGITFIEMETKINPEITCDIPCDLEESNASLIENMNALKDVVDSFENKVPEINAQLYKLKVANHAKDEFFKFDKWARENEQSRIESYSFMTEDEQRRRDEANAHKVAEVQRVANENVRISQEEARQESINNMQTTFNNKIVEIGTAKATVEAVLNNKVLEVDAAKSNMEKVLNQKVAEVNTNMNNNTNKVDEKIVDIQNQLNTRVANKFEQVDANIANKFAEVDAECDEKLEEVDSQISTKLSNVDAKIAEVNTAKNTMEKNVENKLSDVDNRVSTALASGTVDLEVKDARVGYGGKVYSCLNDRITAIESSPYIYYIDIEG